MFDGVHFCYRWALWDNMNVAKKEQAGVMDCPYQDDLELTRAVADGVVEARRILAERLFDRIRRTLSYTCDAATTEDLTQVALIQILRTAGTYRGENRVEAWADRIAVRCALKYFEKSRRRSALADAIWFVARSVESTEEKVFKRQARVRLAQLLRELPEPQALTLVLRYMNGHSVEEIATITAVPVNTVRGRIRTARKKIRKKILSDPVLGDWKEGTVI